MVYQGETEDWDEFIEYDNQGNAVGPGGKILFNQSWDETIESLHTEAEGMSLDEIAENSTPNQKFDIKTNINLSPHGAMTGKLLNNKYATARSAGNYLAGYNASTGTILGSKISWDTYMKMAGAVHASKWNKWNAFRILTFGKSFGPPPWYGEIEYCGRMTRRGWNRGRPGN